VLVALAGASFCFGYNLYYANMHSHTRNSDGIGTPEWAYAYARDTAGIDILAVTDHAEGLTAAEWDDCLEQAEAATDPGEFLGLRGFEWTPNNAYGHCNVLNSNDYISSLADDSVPESLYAFVRREPEAIAQVNHIAGAYLRRFAYSASADSSFCLGEGQVVCYNNYYIPLDSGWRIGAACADDAHQGKWGASRFLTGVWADSLIKESVLDALRKMRTFGTESRRASIRFTAGDSWQGSTIPTGTIQFDITVQDEDTADRFTIVKLMTNRRVVGDSVVVNSNHVEWHPTVTVSSDDRSYYYVLAFINDTVPVWSSPIWVEDPPPPPLDYDVACVGIRAPGATVDSGAVLTPACSVRNYGIATPDSYTIRMKFGAYEETAAVAGPAPGTAMYVTFPPWAADSCGTFAVSCSTELGCDEDASNDRKTGSTSVLGNTDVGVNRLLRPAAPYDSGTIVTPACSTRNYGAQAASYRVRMKVGTYYNKSVLVSSHAAGAAKYVAFPPCTLRYKGNFAVTCSTELGGDRTPSNDRKTNEIAVQPRDAACVKIRAPLGTLDSGIIVTPACTVQNWCITSQKISVRMKVGTFYNKTATTPLLSYRVKRYLTFPPCTLKVTGTHAVTCSTLLANDARPANNKVTGSVTVTSFPLEIPQHDGVVAGKTAMEQGMYVDPNPLASGLAVLRYSLPKAGAATASIYNVRGQTVLAQTFVAGRSGAVDLDLRHLSNGVYVVKFRSRRFIATKKLVVQR